MTFSLHVVTHPWNLHFSHVIFNGQGPALEFFSKMLLANQIAGVFELEYLLNYWRYISTRFFACRHISIEATKIIRVRHRHGYDHACQKCSKILANC